MNISRCIVLSLILSQSLLLSSPLAPSNLTLKAESATTVAMSWNDNSNDELGFKIFRDKTLIKVVPSNIKTFKDVGLLPNTTYKYTIKSTDDTIDEPKLTNVHINEILASNIDVKLDPDYYKFSDYIELKNYQNNSIDISGYTISDNKKSWKIPNGTTLGANGYLLIWADEKNFKKRGLHTNFKLSSKKEKVVLKDSVGNVIDEISYKNLSSNTSVKYINGKLVYMVPSPAKRNQKVYTKITQSLKPIFSKNSGFYDSTQSVTISSSNGAKIYYTLDGSTPTVNSPRYINAINISAPATIKSISIESGKTASEVVTNSYMINFNTTLAVVSLSMDSKYLFDDYIGIYVKGKNGISSPSCSRYKEDILENYRNFNQDWKRPVNMEYFDEDKKIVFNFGVDIAISGQCSRYRNKKKHFSMELSKKYGVKSLSHQLYPSKDNVTKIKDFKLRSGEGGYMISDVLAAMLVENGNFDIDYQAYKTVQMFMNGEYWGIYNIREKKGKDFIKSNYHDIDKVDIIAHNTNGVILKSGNMEAYNSLVHYVNTHDLSNDANYNGILTMIDENNFIDYMVFMIYNGGGSSWLYNNTRFWRESKAGAKWRWMLDDIDGGFRTYNHETLKKAISTNTLISKLFRGLLENNSFKSKFKSRFYKHLDTTFNNENITQLINKIANERREYLDLEKEKWDIDQDLFEESLEKIKFFIKNRVEFIREKINQL